jgi:hypothetical protein
LAFSAIVLSIIVLLFLVRPATPKIIVPAGAAAAAISAAAVEKQIED